MKKNKKHQPIDPASLAPKATAGNITLHSRTIGALPIINHFMERCRLRETLETFLPVEAGRTRNLRWVSLAVDSLPGQGDFG